VSLRSGPKSRRYIHQAIDHKNHNPKEDSRPARPFSYPVEILGTQTKQDTNGSPEARAVDKESSTPRKRSGNTRVFGYGERRDHRGEPQKGGKESRPAMPRSPAPSRCDSPLEAL